MSLKGKLAKPHLQALRGFLEFVDSNPSASVGILALLTQPQHSPSQRSVESWDLHPVFTSDTRSACLKICGWGDAQDAANLDTVCTDNEAMGQFGRSAMLAVMNFNLQRAVVALRASSVPNDTLISLLETFPLRELEDKVRTLFVKLAELEEDEYVSSALLFLSGLTANQILLRKRLEVRDRLAIACRFYLDSALLAFLKAELEQCKASGDPHGVLLTGLTAESLPLIDKYLRGTKDRETGAVLGVYLLRNRVEAAHAWVDDYTSFLNLEGLFEQRCLFDIEKNRMLGAASGQSASSPNCATCGNSLGSSHLLEPSHRSTWNDPHTRSLFNHCTHCRKLLPKCALCMRPLNYTNPYLELSKAKSAQSPPKPQEQTYTEWVGWCQRCKHGGHVGHLTQWFDSNVECPVSGCSCRCNALDEETS